MATAMADQSFELVEQSNLEATYSQTPRDTRAMMTAMADKLFGLIEQGNFEAATELFDPDAQIKQYLSGAATVTAISDFPSAMAQLVAKVGAPVYLNRRVSMWEGGFVEQHTSWLAHPIKGPLYVDVWLVGHVSAAGKITLLKEYVDPSTVAPAAKL